MTAAITLALFFVGMMLVSGFRFSLSKFFVGDLRRRLDVTGRNPVPRPGLVGRLAMPTNLDIIPALIFVSCFAPMAYP